MNAPAKIEAGRLVMNSGGRWKGEYHTAEPLIEDVAALAKSFSYPLKLTIDDLGATLDYKALLMGYWFPEMARQFTERGRPTTKEEMHTLMCHQFFGYTDRQTIGKTEIKPTLITITTPRQKTRGELYDFCRQIEEWCQKVGVTLPDKDSQYSQDKAKEDA